MISVVSPIDLTLFFILLMFHFELGEQASLKPFQFQCYSNDICTWPLQYCSSKVHEHRCIPCLRSVCSLESPPLQCLYNCSLIGQKENATEIANEGSGDCIQVIVFVVFGLCVTFSIPVACLVTKLWKLKKTMTKNERKSEEMHSLITSLKKEKKGSVEQENEMNKSAPSQDNDSYAQRKLTDVPPTRDTSSPGSYKPTTHLDKPLSSRL